MSEKLEQYAAAMRCLNAAERAGNSIGEDAILDELDELWRAMTADEREQARKIK